MTPNCIGRRSGERFASIILNAIQSVQFPAVAYLRRRSIIRSDDRKVVLITRLTVASMDYVPSTTIGSPD